MYRRGPPAYIGEVKVRYPAVHLLDPNVVLCSATRCGPMMEGDDVYRNDSHLNDAGSRMIGRKLLALGAKL